MTTRRETLALMALLSAGLPGPAAAQGGADRPVRILVPFPAGGSTDRAARVIGARLSETLKQTVVVENRPGAGGQIAVTTLLQAPADGHTLLLGDIGVLAINPSVYPNLSYDPQRDFAPIGMVMQSPMVLLASAKKPYRTLQEVIDAARAKPQALSYGSQGNGTGGHLVGELFKAETATSILHVPYKGGAPAMKALVGGDVDLGFFVLGAALPQIRGGTVRALALAAPQRSARAPDVPPFGELGHPGVLMTVWTALVARQGTPGPVVERLSRELRAAVGNAEVVKPLTEHGYDATASSADELGRLMRRERQTWATVSKATGARIE